jgi:hypothetical protein
MSKMRIGNILLEKIFFQTDQPFDPSNFVHLRKKISEKGLEFLLGESVSLHPKAKTEDEVQIDTTRSGEKYHVSYGFKINAATRSENKHHQFHKKIFRESLPTTK